MQLINSHIHNHKKQKNGCCDFCYNLKIFQGLLPNNSHSNGYIADSTMDLPALVEDDMDVSEFKFSKFAAMYFQGNATHTHIRKALRQPLLSLSNEGDQLV